MKQKSLPELQSLKSTLEDRIRRIEADLKAPLESDSSEQAVQLGQLELIRKLLEVERSRLTEVNHEIETMNS